MPSSITASSVSPPDERTRDDGAARLSAAVDAALLGLYEVGRGSDVVYLNARMRLLLGVPGLAAGDVRAFWSRHIDPRDRDRVLEAHRTLGDTTAKRDAIEYRYAHPDGRTLWFSDAAQVVERDSLGVPSRLVGVVRDITDSKMREDALREALEEVQRLRDQLHHENVYLRQEASAIGGGSNSIIGRSAAIQRVTLLAEHVAPTSSTVLLMGETGTGKERFAAAIHDLSPRRKRAMIRVSCSAIPTTLIESELFGREKGAYTGALSRQLGRFEMAHGSTIFLDEIGELPQEVQVKLLRVLQERQVERLGSSTPIPVDVRIIAATNRDLEKAVRDGLFREDLYYRLAVFPITLPPLRERPEDLPQLIDSLVDELSGVMGKPVKGVSPRSLESLARYHWPGNVRELRNAIERAMILSSGPWLHIDLPSRALQPAVRESSDGSRNGTLERVEREHLLNVLHDTGWRIRGARGAAGILGLKPTTLETRMAKLGIFRPGRRLPPP